MSWALNSKMHSELGQINARLLQGLDFDNVGTAIGTWSGRDNTSVLGGGQR